MLKTGLGSLLLTDASTNYGASSYAGAMRVDDGTLTLGYSGALAGGTQLIIDNGAIVDLDWGLVRKRSQA